jgi:hypothetical protein
MVIDGCVLVYSCQRLGFASFNQPMHLQIKRYSAVFETSSEHIPILQMQDNNGTLAQKVKHISHHETPQCACCLTWLDIQILRDG